MVSLILFLPFLSSVWLGFCGRLIGKLGSSLFSSISIFFCMIFCWISFFEVGFFGSFYFIKITPWISSDYLFISWGILFDSLTVTMLVVISTISWAVHIYSISYMEKDPHIPRFLSYLSLFTFFMIILVTADNFIQMFVGWEGVGLASFLLISFWFTRLNAGQSAIKALILNRVGDVGLCISLFALFHVFKSLEYELIFTITPYMLECCFLICKKKFLILPLSSTFLFIGSIGKSAQLGLHGWLPDAMEGPTPVSALIHAATMVTAGIFLLARCSPILEFAPKTLGIVAIIGAATCFFAATIGGFQYDLKKVIAFSTTSQLGYMIFACGISKYNASVFHLMNHAFFKALLFLSAGCIIHSLSDEQDMRRMGGLVQLLPLTYSIVIIGSFSLIGFPFLTGFYSKDFILELAYIYKHVSTVYLQTSFIHWLVNASVFFTAFYSFRLIFLSFLNKTNLSKTLFKNIQEGSFLFFFPLYILSIGSIFLGYFIKDLFIGLGTDFWQQSIFFYPTNIFLFELEDLFVQIKLFPFIVSLSGFFSAFISNIIVNNFFIKCQITLIGKNLVFFFNKKWYLDQLINTFLVLPLIKFSYYIVIINLDRGFIEVVGPLGTSQGIYKFATNLIWMQSGQIVHYILYMLMSFIFIITINVCFEFYPAICKYEFLLIYLCLYGYTFFC